MPRSATWPSGIATESLSNMDSAGSCDSVISMNSVSSEDNLGHLSAEEKACLIYLEETIESLEIADDSGLSSDEPDSGQMAATTSHLPSAWGHVTAHDELNFKHGRDEKSFLSVGVPTPLLLANGIGSLPPRAPAGVTEPKPPEVLSEPISTASAFDKAGQYAVIQATEPQTTVVHNNSKAPTLTPNTTPTQNQSMSIDLKSQSKSPVTEPETPPAVTQTEMLDSATDGDNDPKDTSLYPGPSSMASELDLALIPPPSDFRDEPEPEEEKEVPPSEKEAPPSKKEVPPSEKEAPLSEKEGPPSKKEVPPSDGTSGNQMKCIDLELLRKKVSMRNTLVSPPISCDPPSSPHSVPISVNTPASPATAQPNPISEIAEPRSPPAVAPKPKKLPSNIILKSHKTSVAGSDGNSGHSLPSTSDRAMLDPQRVRMEALRKLGLLKSDEADTSPSLSPKLSPNSRRSWAIPGCPITPPAPHTPTSPSIPSPARVINSPSPSVPPTSTTFTEIQAADILPAPPAFSDSIEPVLLIGLSSVNNVSESTNYVRTQSSTPPNTPAELPKKLTPPKITGIKSASLECSDTGLSPKSSEAENDLSQLRNTIPRPASLGGGRDFSSIQGDGLPETRKSLPASTATKDSQKLPRSHGVSVLICPRAQNREDRHEALRKLGLLRD
ncbi:specifically androgen-regulated gene protein [Lampris incognitus]|uniref:specifically androgen-regulated gene protein n=1 Tax=Lampris incognitus TaxID=2546036 RepID=UPI0024B496D7|nr:specifically androgen-regulated gene protein [Lampris incognitus]